MSRTSNHTFATHANPHWDEFAALALMLCYGSQHGMQFPKGGPTIQFGGSYPKGAVVIGDDHGDFDEHKPQGRLAEMCASLLVAKYFGIENLPELQVLLSEVLRSDTQPGQLYFELGFAIKTMQDFGRSHQEILAMVRAIIDARIKKDRNENPRATELIAPDARVNLKYVLGETTTKVRTIVLNPQFTVLNLATVWYLVNFPSEIEFEEEVNLILGTQTALEHLDDQNNVLYVGIPNGHFGEGGQINTVNGLMKYLGLNRQQRLGVIRKELRRWENGEEPKPFELPALVELMRDFGSVTVEEIYTEILAPMLDAQHRSGKQFFMDCPGEFEKSGYLFSTDQLTVAMVVSDLVTMNAWCRTVQKADVVVLRSSSGNVQVFTTPDHRDVAKFIATELAIAESVSKDDLRKLALQIEEGRDAVMPGAPNWYLFQSAGQILNGSKSHPGVPATELSNDQLEEAVLNGVTAYEESLR